MAQFFRRQGFSATEHILGGADGGVDVMLTRGSERFLVQCKHWSTRAVGPSVVRELNGVIAARGAAGGFVVTSGSFTAAARAFAAEAGIQLVDGIALRSGAALQTRTAAAVRTSDNPARSKP